MRRLAVLAVLLAGGCATESELDRARNAFDQGHYELAHQRATRSLEVDPQHKREAYELRVLCWLAKGQLEEAREDLEEATQHSLPLQNLRWRLALAYRERAEGNAAKGDLPRAKEDHASALELNPSIPKTAIAKPYLERASASAGVGALASALACLDVAAAFLPAEGNVLLDRAAVEAAAGDRASARKDLHGVPDVREWRKGTLLLRGLLDVEDDPERAWKELDAAAAESVGPHVFSDCDIEFTRADIEARLGRSEVASAHFRAAAQRCTHSVKEHPPSAIAEDQARFLILAPDIEHTEELTALAVARHARAAEAWRKIDEETRGLRELLRKLEEGTLPPPAEVEAQAPAEAPAKETDPFRATAVQETAALREKVVEKALKVWSEAQAEKRFEDALAAAEVALKLVSNGARGEIQEKRDLLARTLAEDLARQAGEELADDPFRAEKLVERALELHATPEISELAKKIEAAVRESEPSFIKLLDAKREGEGVLVSFELGADNRATVAAPGQAHLTVNGIVKDADVKATDYARIDVVVEGKSVGVERVFAFEKISGWKSVPKEVKVELYFFRPGAKEPLKATKTVTLGE